MLYYLRIRMTIYVAVLKNRNNFLYMYVFLNCAMNFLVPTKIMGAKIYIESYRKLRKPTNQKTCKQERKVERKVNRCGCNGRHRQSFGIFFHETFASFNGYGF